MSLVVRELSATSHTSDPLLYCLTSIKPLRGCSRYSFLLLGNRVSKKSCRLLLFFFFSSFTKTPPNTSTALVLGPFLLNGVSNHG